MSCSRDGIHPAVKIVSFIVFSICLSLGGGTVLGAAFFLFIATYLVAGRDSLKGALVMLLRIRWLFLSIFIVYLSFTPGEPLWVSSIWLPSVEGIAQGAYRVAVLVLVILAARMLMNTISQNGLIGALYWLLEPFKAMGNFRLTFVVRLVLTIEYVDRVQSLLVSERERISSRNTSVVTKWGDYFFNVFERLVSKEGSGTEWQELPLLDAPPLKQWCIPLSMIVLFTSIM